MQYPWLIYFVNRQEYTNASIRKIYWDWDLKAEDNSSEEGNWATSPTATNVGREDNTFFATAATSSAVMLSICAAYV